MSTRAPLQEYELEFRVIGVEFEGEYFAVRADGRLHLVLRYRRPGLLWLAPIDEAKLYHFEGEEVDGYDTNEFGVAEYSGRIGDAIHRRGVLVKPAWARTMPGWTASELFDGTDELDPQRENLYPKRKQRR